MTHEELRKPKITYEIQGQNHAGCWERIYTSTISYIAGYEFYKRFVSMCCNPDSKFDRMQLVKFDEKDELNEVLIFKDRVPL